MKISILFTGQKRGNIQEGHSNDFQLPPMKNDLLLHESDTLGNSLIQIFNARYKSLIS